MKTNPWDDGIGRYSGIERDASASSGWNSNRREWYRFPMKTTPPAEAGAPASIRPPSGAWTPLQTALFRNLWIATIVSNVGTWMQDVGAGWLMTSLSSSPSMVALVEAADSIPLMLLALPAGALADIVDRRRLLIAVQVYLLVVAGTLGILTLLEITTP